MATEVLIIGAGPSGLTLALCLAKLGVSVRIVDRADGPGQTPRAFAIQARTLELYDQLDLAGDMIARGRVISAMNVHIGRKQIQKIPFGDFGLGLSPFPFVLLLQQDDFEKLLIERLAAAGVQVEYGVALIDLRAADGKVLARLDGPGRTSHMCEATYICGCDGVSSTVRELCGIDLPGRTSDAIFYIADVMGRGSIVNGELHYIMTGSEMCSVFPQRGSGRVRLIGTAPESVRKRDYQIHFDDVATDIERDTGLEVAAVESFATYRVHQRIAGDWRKGSIFLLGEACHVHSPAGGQGLNAGVGDAFNLAWKLAAVLKSGADPILLETYQSERMQAARQIAAATDLGFALQSSRGAAMDWVRRALTRMAPKLMHAALFRRWAFRTISQLSINYRHSVGWIGAGHVATGDRLPWVRSETGVDNFALLKDLRWRLQVFGRASEALQGAGERWRIQVDVFGWTREAGSAGLVENAAYLVRPDGYVACVSRRQSASNIRQALERFEYRSDDNSDDNAARPTT